MIGMMSTRFVGAVMLGAGLLLFSGASQGESEHEQEMKESTEFIERVIAAKRSNTLVQLQVSYSQSKLELEQLKLLADAQRAGIGLPYLALEKANIDVPQPGEIIQELPTVYAIFGSGNTRYAALRYLSGVTIDVRVGEVLNSGHTVDAISTVDVIVKKDGVRTQLASGPVVASQKQSTQPQNDQPSNSANVLFSSQAAQSDR